MLSPLFLLACLSFFFFGHVARAAPIPVARPDANPSLLSKIGDVVGAVGDALSGDGTDITDPIASDPVANTAGVQPLNSTGLESFVSVAQFSRAAYCSAPAVIGWTCGPACDANPETQVLFAAGDDAAIPGFFIAFSPPTQSIIVAHQGTDPTKLLSILNDVEFLLVDPPEDRFPGAQAAGVQIHSGFLDTFDRTADQVLASVKQGISQKNATNVIVTGHSLGGAISLLDTLFLRSQLDASIPISTTVFGLPRVGNSQFADLVGKTVDTQSFQFFTNGPDPVPKVPPTELGFIHPIGEIFQKMDVKPEAAACPGQENENCSAGISLLDSDVGAHAGPYVGVSMGQSFCSA